MQWVALIVVIACGAWLIGVAVLMALRPGYALGLLQRMSRSLDARNWRLQLIEQGLRIVAGAALIVRAPEAKWPMLFSVFGWFLVATSLVILAVPMRWHGAYGSWWGDRIRPAAIRLLSPVPLLVGAGLIYAAL